MDSPVAEPKHVWFAGNDEGAWHIDRITSVVGDGLPAAARLSITEGSAPQLSCAWTLRGCTSNARYTTRREMTLLTSKQAPLSRPFATRGALIPIKKSGIWWALPQDERRHIYEELSRHTSIGLEYLPRIARRLHHARELGEPFDFLTWFEFASEHEPDFDHLLERLRAREEWRYVEREVEIRVRLDA